MTNIWIIGHFVRE